MAKITAAVETNVDHAYFDPQYLDDCGGKMQYDMPKVDSASLINVFDGHTVTIYTDKTTEATAKRCLIVIGQPGVDYTVTAAPDLSVMIGKKGGVPIMKYSF